MHQNQKALFQRGNFPLKAKWFFNKVSSTSLGQSEQPDP
jgi:hypothetical protein